MMRLFTLKSRRASSVSTAPDVEPADRGSWNDLKKFFREKIERYDMSSFPSAYSYSEKRVSIDALREMARMEDDFMCRSLLAAGY